MPLVEIRLLEGRSNDQKKALLAAVTGAVRDSLGSPLETIRVWIQEVPPEEFMAAGVLASEKKK